MEKLISFLKTEFPKDALEIQECIELLNQCIGVRSAAMQVKANCFEDIFLNC